MEEVRSSILLSSTPGGSVVDEAGSPVDSGHVAPESLELVVVARLLQEDVDDEVAVVDEDPVAVVEALDAQWPRAALLDDLLLDRVGDGAHLAGVRAAGDHEPPRDGEHLAALEDDRLGALLVVRGASRGYGPAV